MLNSKNSFLPIFFNWYLSKEKTAFVDKSTVEPAIVFIEIFFENFSLVIFMGNRSLRLYVPGPFTLLQIFIQVFMKERERDDNFLSLEDIYEVLDEKHSSGDKLREGIVGYPSHPLYKQIACMLQVWMDTK